MNSCRIGWFGKLPLSPEFIKSNYSGTLLAELDEWIQEGIYHTKHNPAFGDSWQQDFLHSAPWNFMFHDESTQDFLIGTAHPSQDRAGRSFPFLLFLHFNGRDLSMDPMFSPLYFEDFLLEAQRIVSEGWQNEDLSSYRVKLAALSSPNLNGEIGQSSQQRYRKFLHTETSEQFWDDLAGKDSDTTHDHFRTKFTTFLSPFKNDSPSRIPWGLKFPLIPKGTLSSPVDVLLWVDLVQRELGTKRLPKLIIWTRNTQPEKSFALMFFQKPRPKAFGCLIRTDFEDDSWRDFTFKETAQSENFLNTNPDEAAATSTDTDSTFFILDWLNQFGRLDASNDEETRFKVPLNQVKS